MCQLVVSGEAVCWVSPISCRCYVSVVGVASVVVGQFVLCLFAWCGQWDVANMFCSFSQFSGLGLT